MDLPWHRPPRGPDRRARAGPRPARPRARRHFRGPGGRRARLQRLGAGDAPRLLGLRGHGSRTPRLGDPLVEQREFEAMLALDERHWWYRGRRRMLDALLAG